MTDSPHENEAGTSPETRPAVKDADATAVSVRASDADRDRIADILREALAEGRLDAEEHSERIDTLYSAKTLGELEPLVRHRVTPVTQADLAPGAPWRASNLEGASSMPPDTHRSQ